MNLHELAADILTRLPDHPRDRLVWSALADADIYDLTVIATGINPEELL